MPIMESVSYALFMMVMVFAVLLGLYVCIKLFSFVLNKLEKKFGSKNK